MREEVAKTKWCPETAIAFWFKPEGADMVGMPLGVAVNRAEGHQSIINQTRCLGSGCMMWRTVKDQNGVDTDRGYCGLAGQP